ncbi:MAG: amidohydrolase family protein [Pseudomonadota bacterium]
MNRRIVLCLLGLLALPAQAADLLLKGGRLVTGTEMGVLEGASVLVRDGKIVEVGMEILAPGAEVIDAAGRTVTVGFLDSNTLVGLGEIESSSVSTDHYVRNTELGAGFRVSLGYDRFASGIPILRSEGVTRALVVPTARSEVFAGQSALVHLGPGKSLINDSNAVFAYLGEDSRGLAGGSRAKALLDLADALREAENYRTNRRAFESGRLRELRESQLDLEALQPVIQGTKPLALYIDRAADIETTLGELEPFGLRLVLVGGREAWKVADLLAEKDIPVVLNVLDNAPSDFDRMGARLDNAKLLHEAGVRIALMTEDQFNELRSLSQAAGVAVAYGLPWTEAIAAVTSSAAQIWGIDDHYGTIAVGKDADLVVWDGDPLEVMSAPAVVLIGGKRVGLESRQTRLRDRYENLREAASKPFGYR